MIREVKRRPRGDDGLTDRQRAVWRHMLDFQGAHGRAPTWREAGEALGGLADGSIHAALTALVGRGFVLESKGDGRWARRWAVDPSAPASPGDLEWVLSRAESDRIERAVRVWLGRETRDAPEVGPLAPARAGRALAAIAGEWLGEGRA